MSRDTTLLEQAETFAERKQFPEAKRLYEQACRENGGDVRCWLGLGEVHARLGNAREALSCFEQVTRIDPAAADAQFRIGNLLRERGEFDGAEQAYAKAVAVDPGLHLAHYFRGNMLKLQGRAEEARDAYDRVLQIEPGFVEARWNRERVLPVIYDDQAQVQHYRDRYAQGLENLARQVDLDTPSGRASALRGLAASTNFFLQYQGRDDLALQQRYGELLTRIACANFPQWAQHREMPPPGADGRIRIGYASAFLRAHNGAVWLLGWLRCRDRAKFEVYCYHTGSAVDAKTAEFEALCDHFHHIPGNAERACARIAADNLHILVYPELGMEVATMIMAGLRLAPVQCVGWGHPITSGLASMDYWLSSDLMEPDDGQAHYSERLVRLPNMAHYYAPDAGDATGSATGRRTRAEFGLREDAVLYLCNQSLFKYLPAYDYLFPEIARRVPAAQFVFLAISSVHVVRRFMQRIEAAFRAAGLDARNHCVMLGRLPQHEFMNLNRIADVFLDNPSWSGNNTALAAIDCRLPIVTLPTEFMRGRHCCGILKMMGMEQTIARDAGEYVELAARLGNDRAWRDERVEDIGRLRERIYRDSSCVQALEAFYAEAVEERLQRQSRGRAEHREC